MRQAIRLKASRGSRVSQWVSVPAPVGGWDTMSPLAAMPPDHAPILDNFTPQPGYVELRRGYIRWATGMPSYPVETLMTWCGPLATKMFAVCNGKIYDTTTQGSTGASVVSGLGNGRFWWLNFSALGGNYLLFTNGIDGVQLYDGTTWSTSSITGASDPTKFIYPTAHKGRLWLIEKNTLNLWYLEPGSISGAATVFALGAQFYRGGRIVAIGTYTGPQGFGTDNYFVALSSQGEALVYAGTDPSSASSWALVGRYNIGTPVGDRPLRQYGSDLAVISLDGFLLFSKVTPLDRADSAKVAVSTTIQPTVTAATTNYRNNPGWEICSYPKSNIVLVNVPVVSGITSQQYVLNTLTAAWSRWTNINAATWCLVDDSLYFGGMSGTVYQADVGAFDNEAPIVADMQCAFSAFGSPGMIKQWKMVQPQIITDGSVAPLVAVDADYQTSNLSGTPTITTGPTTAWGSFTWGQAPWAQADHAYQPWAGSSALGRVGSVRMRISTQIPPPRLSALWGNFTWGAATWGAANNSGASIQINSFNVLVESGDGI